MSCRGAKSWHWSILRPVLIIGEAMGGAMDLIPPLGVYAAVLRAQGRPLDYPGGAPRVAQAVRRRSAGARDRLVGRCRGRAQRSVQRHQWRRLHLGEHLAGDRGCARHDAGRACAVVAGEGVSEMDSALGRAAQDARSDRAWPRGVRRPVRSSMPITACAMGRPNPVRRRSCRTVKINQAGFTEMMDTEVMFRKWFKLAKASRLLP